MANTKKKPGTKKPAAKKQRYTSVLLRDLSADDSKLIEDLQVATWEKTASKALLRGGHKFLEMEARLEGMEIDRDAWKEKYRELWDECGTMMRVIQMKEENIKRLNNLTKKPE